MTYVNAGMDPIYDDPSKAGVGTNWQNEIYNENAPIMNHQASISGGGDKGSYFLSFGYFRSRRNCWKEEKISPDYKRYNVSTIPIMCLRIRRINSSVVSRSVRT